MEKTGVIYRLECLKCSSQGKYESYVGETGRMLKDRLKEHMRIISDIEEFKKKTNNMSMVEKHSFVEHGSTLLEDWKVEIIGNQSETQNRKIVEAKFIREFKPTINEDGGIKIIV